MVRAVFSTATLLVPTSGSLDLGNWYFLREDIPHYLWRCLHQCFISLIVPTATIYLFCLHYLVPNSPEQGPWLFYSLIHYLVPTLCLEHLVVRLLRFNQWRNKSKRHIIFNKFTRTWSKSLSFKIGNTCAQQFICSDGTFQWV